MSAATFNMTANAGADFSRKFKLKIGDVTTDITNYTLTGVAKQHHTKTSGSVSFTLTKTNASAGEFTMNLTETQTASMTPGTWSYDCKADDGSGTTTTLIRGYFTVEPNVA
tara:strand:+ start:316 stop:648 length:333 start_codon:yes stop_codon:yes gene_type:complete